MQERTVLVPVLLSAEQFAFLKGKVGQSITEGQVNRDIGLYLKGYLSSAISMALDDMMQPETVDELLKEVEPLKPRKQRSHRVNEETKPDEGHGS